MHIYIYMRIYVYIYSKYGNYIPDGIEMMYAQVPPDGTTLSFLSQTEFSSLRRGNETPPVQTPAKSCGLTR